MFNVGDQAEVKATGEQGRITMSNGHAQKVCGKWYLTAELKTLAKTANDYAKPQYWSQRFQDTEGVFDWYATYAELETIFLDFCMPKQGLDVLMVGCGNSSLSAEMHEAGYKRIVNIDISSAAVKKMEERFHNLGMEWREMDATAMTFEDNCFDLAVDKGTLDAMMVGSEASIPVSAMTSEIWRTLRPGGVLILVSHNGNRMPLLDRAVENSHGTQARWQQLDVRKCCLSPQAMLINILRSKLNGRPLAEAFADSEMLRAAAAETKKALKQMQFLEAFRLFKAKKAAQAKKTAAAEKEAEGSSEAPAKSAKATQSSKIAKPEEGSSSDDEPRDPRRQPYCWVYALQKPHM